MLNKLLDRWHATSAYRSYAIREPNERLIIVVVVTLIICSLLYLLLWQPLASWSASAAEAHEREQSLNDWMLLNEKEARERVLDGGPKTTGEGLLTIVSRTADKAQLKLTRFQPESDGVSVVLQKQPFNDVLSWLNVLEKEEGVLVVQASVDADSLSGRVNARFSLRQ